MAATLMLLVGLPGAGKTTLARQLETGRAALRLTPDEWMAPLFGAGEAGEQRWLLESDLLWNVAARVLTLGMSVVLDYGCWARQERDLFRARAAALDVAFELHVLEVPLETLWARLDARNAALPPHTFPVTRAELETWAGWYEGPDHAELAPTTQPPYRAVVHRWPA
ncbi:AAA family ATPase [Deinococcus sp. HMF7604]|uniref:AAA family ATPase n=1 Tax=Deinococcus betulae TaxID=2873312 RepID=UPI001CCCAF64|nr:AAA family ATPase [Deinococcus betulae]MBZ9751635.1 AAA family ATPase [Deinococcus betulae]